MRISGSIFTQLKAHLKLNPTLRKLKRRLDLLQIVKFDIFEHLISEISEHDVSVVIDVGANVGQFGFDLRKAGYSGQIYSFEPTTNAFQELVKTSRNDRDWHIFRVALGSINGAARINISGNSSLSSSFLKVNPKHLEIFPNSHTISQEEVTVNTLDTVFSENFIDPNKVLLKIDTQGFELEVLRGALKALEFIPLCFLEISITELYEEEPKMLEILNLLNEYGKNVSNMTPGVTKTNGEILQFDLLAKKIN